MPRRVKKLTQQALTLDIAPLCAIYIRVSTSDQARGYGLDAQRAKCLQMAAFKSWTVSAEYQDAAISGAKDADERPGLAALLEDVATGKVNAVIVPSLDRLGRTVEIILRTVDRIAKAGASLVSCREQFDTGTPAGRLTLGIFASLAEYERDLIAERTTGGREQRGQRDGERGALTPLGYRRAYMLQADGKRVSRIEVDDVGAGLVRRIFAMRDRDGLTLRAIAEVLNADQVPNPKGGKQWHAATVKTILDNRDYYTGGLRGGSPTPWPAILN